MTTTKLNPVPVGYQCVTPYLAVHGAGKLIDFLKTILDAKDGNCTMKEPDGSVSHAEIMVDGSMIMVGEAPADRDAMPAMMYVYVQDSDAVYQRALDAGATSIMPPTDKPYGDRTAAVQDMCGNQWYIATRK